MTTPLTGQVVAVVGGTKGIGAAMADELASAGATVAVAGRDLAAGEAVAAKIVENGGEAFAVACDVTNAADCQALVDGIAARSGHLDTLFANQGVAGAGGALTDSSDDDVARCLHVNLVGCLSLARSAKDLLAADGGGRFVVTGSAAGHQNIPMLGMYGISKAAASHLVRQLAVEWRGLPIAVNELVPGPVRTEMTGFEPGGEPGPDGIAELFEDFTTQAAEWLKDPEDVAPLARFLAELPTDGPSGQVFSLSGRV